MLLTKQLGRTTAYNFNVFIFKKLTRFIMNCHYDSIYVIKSMRDITYIHLCDRNY